MQMTKTDGDGPKNCRKYLLLQKKKTNRKKKASKLQSSALPGPSYASLSLIVQQDLQ